MTWFKYEYSDIIQMSKEELFILYQNKMKCLKKVEDYEEE